MAAAVTAEQTGPSPTTASAREAAARFVFEMPPGRIEKSNFARRFDHLPRDNGAIQRSPKMELNALLLQAFESESLTEPPTLVADAFDALEHDVATVPGAVDEVLERLYLDVARDDEFYLSARR
jgi:hypothetical protein